MSGVGHTRMTEPDETVEIGAGRALPGALADPKYLNRELSWLDFNARVLALAEDASRPLLERAKFLAIVSQNLDEFFQVRVAGLKEQVMAGINVGSPDGMTPREQLRAIRPRTAEMMERQANVFTEQVAPALEKVGIRYSDWSSLDDDDREYLVKVYEEKIFPVLTPLAVDPAHPFPYISNLSLNLAVLVRSPSNLTPRFARVKVPPLLPRFVVMPDGERFVPVEQVIAEHLDVLFPGMEVLEHHPFRVTRDADPDLAEEASAGVLAAVEGVLRERRRSANVVRLEIHPTMSEEVRALLMRELELDESEVYSVGGPIDLSGLWALYSLDRPELKDDHWTPATQPRLTNKPGGELPTIFDVIQGGDVLVHHPYDSFTTSVEAFIRQAAEDPTVLAIKQTLYRTSGGESPIVKALIRAAERGKQVVALVELQARFDEQANIAWARVLEEAGVHVVYGVVGLKTHAKTTLVVRQEQARIRRYVHVGTGNYNPNTALIYEDVGLLSVDEELGGDLTELFNFLTGYSRQRQYNKLVVTPSGGRALREAMLELIEAESSGPGGRIVLKMNSLVDAEIIDALYWASARGTQVDLIVRGICCLVPGVPGLSEGISVRSIVGRFLEHSRIFRFGADDATAHYYIGSADLMPRNLDRRVEAVVPVTEPALRGRLAEILEVNLADDVLAWELSAEGEWAKVPTVRGLNTHERLQELALARAQGVAAPPLPDA
jgi:polyphosphate kinase